VAIAAALGLDGVSTPERLVAFSLASYANREHRAWPSAAAAAARAGMSRGRFLAARDGLVRAGLVAIEDSRGGRGRSSRIRLPFAETGERFDAEINAQCSRPRSRRVVPAVARGCWLQSSRRWPARSAR
jgi:hypothetical protein